MKFIRSFYITSRLFMLLMVNFGVFMLGYFYPVYFSAGKIMLLCLGALSLLDILFVYARRTSIEARREMPDKLSNGDPNEIKLIVRSRYPYPVRVQIFEELPEQLQVRSMTFSRTLMPGKEKTIAYSIRPVRRGEYVFGAINLYVSGLLSLVQRRIKRAEGDTVPVYPSYVQLRKYELLAVSNRLNEVGVKKVRRVGRAMEYDHIRDYVLGDDIRTLNWKATARRGSLMVNQFQDEKAQQVYCVIDKGRSMKMPFEEMSLLDYAINATLVLSSIVQLKYDKAGLVTYSDKLGTIVTADRKSRQMDRIIQALYSQKTAYQESSLEHVYLHLKRQISTRSLILLFTNYESLTGMRRQLPYLKLIAKQHLVVVVFFENTELRELTTMQANDLESVYRKTIAEKFVYEKRQIVKELQQNGIQAILTPPQNLTVNTLNKYLEIKARGML